MEKLAKEQKLGTEEMGRKIRYEFFNEVAQKEIIIMINIATIELHCAISQRYRSRNKPAQRLEKPAQSYRSACAKP